MVLKQIGLRGLALVKTDEGLRLVAYDDATGRVAVPGCRVIGKVTIAWGHTGPDVHPGDEVTRAQADELLVKDLSIAEHSVNYNVTCEINQNQFDAMVVFAYNCGIGAFQSSTLLKKVNNGDFAGAAAEFARWNKKNVDGLLTVDAGLTKRRADEAALFVLQEV